MLATYLKGNGVWVWGAVAALLVVAVWFSTQAFAASMTVTAEPLQNPGGDITHTSDWSSASAIVTRHEATRATIDGSDQITQVTVEGTKASGAADVTVDLVDNAAAIVDTKTVALSTASGAFSQAVALTLGTIKYDTIVKIAASYASSGSVAIVFDAFSGANFGKSNNHTLSHTVGAGGANRILVVGVSPRSTTVSGVTYGGQALTLVTGGAQSSPGNARAELWYKVAPLENANDIVVTLPGNDWAVVGATSWTQVHQTTPFGTAATASGTSTAPSVPVTSGTGDVVVDVLAAAGNPTTTVDGSQTQRWNTANGNKITGAGSHEDGGASSTTMSWALGASGDWAIVGVALKQASPKLIAVTYRW